MKKSTKISQKFILLALTFALMIGVLSAGMGSVFGAITQRKMVAGDTVNFAGHTWDVVTISSKNGGAMLIMQDMVNLTLSDKTNPVVSLQAHVNTLIPSASDRNMIMEREWVRQYKPSSSFTKKDGFTAGVGIFNVTDWTNWKSKTSNPTSPMLLATDNMTYVDTSGNIVENPTIGATAKIRPALMLKAMYAYVDSNGDVAMVQITPPTNFATGVITGGSVELSWTAAEGEGLTGYVLLRDGVVIYEGTATSFKDVTATLGSTYVYDLYPAVGADYLVFPKSTVTATTPSTSVTTKMQRGDSIKYGGKLWTVIEIKPDGGAYILRDDVDDTSALYGGTYTNSPQASFNVLTNRINTLIPDVASQDWLMDMTYDVRSVHSLSTDATVATSLTSDSKPITPSDITQKLGYLSLPEYNLNKDIIKNATRDWATRTVVTSDSGVFSVNANGTVSVTNIGVQMGITNLIGLRPVAKLKPEYSYKTSDGTAVQVPLEDVENFKIQDFGTSARLTWDAQPFATGYEIKRTGLVEPIILSKDVTLYDISGLTAGMPYDITVTALYGGLKSPGVTKSTTDVDLPETPTNPTNPTNPTDPTDPSDPSDPSGAVEKFELWNADSVGGEFVSKAVPKITVIGGKAVKDLKIDKLELGFKEPVQTTEGEILLTSDGEGNTLVNIPTGLGTATTDTTLEVTHNGTHFLTIVIKPKPVLNFSF